MLRYLPHYVRVKIRNLIQYEQITLGMYLVNLLKMSQNSDTHFTKKRITTTVTFKLRCDTTFKMFVTIHFYFLSVASLQIKILKYIINLFYFPFREM
jgi:hypothetical protein